MQFINPGLLGRWNVFRDTYVNATLDETHKEMLKEMTQPFILRRTKEEVLDDLPEKVEGVHYVSLSDNELEVYETMRSITSPTRRRTARPRRRGRQQKSWTSATLMN